MARRPGRFDVRWENGAGEWDRQTKAAFVAALGKRSRTGIYRLRFADGQAYVGQAVEVVRRIDQHAAQRWQDIVGVDFRVEEREVLDSAEIATIRHFEKPRHLRNKNLAAHMFRDVELDQVVPVDEQDRWLRGASLDEVTPVDALADSSAAVAGKDRARLERLWGRADFDQILDVTRKYVEAAILAPAQTVGRFWTVVPYPRKENRASMREVLRIHVHGLHAMSVLEDESRPAEPVRYQVIVSEPRISAWHQRLRWAVTAARAGGISGENNGLGYFEDLLFEDPERFRRFLSEPFAREASRELTWARMRRGLAGGPHSNHLAAQILAGTNKEARA